MKADRRLRFDDQVRQLVGRVVPFLILSANGYVLEQLVTGEDFWLSKVKNFRLSSA